MMPSGWRARRPLDAATLEERVAEVAPSIGAASAGRGDAGEGRAAAAAERRRRRAVRARARTRARPRRRRRRGRHHGGVSGARGENLEARERRRRAEARAIAGRRGGRRGGHRTMGSTPGRVGEVATDARHADAASREDRGRGKTSLAGAARFVGNLTSTSTRTPHAETILLLTAGQRRRRVSIPSRGRAASAGSRAIYPRRGRSAVARTSAGDDTRSSARSSCEHRRRARPRDERERRRGDRARADCARLGRGSQGIGRALGIGVGEVGVCAGVGEGIRSRRVTAIARDRRGPVRVASSVVAGSTRARVSPSGAAACQWQPRASPLARARASRRGRSPRGVASPPPSSTPRVAVTTRRRRRRRPPRGTHAPRARRLLTQLSDATPRARRRRARGQEGGGGDDARGCRGCRGSVEESAEESAEEGAEGAESAAASAAASSAESSSARAYSPWLPYPRPPGQAGGPPLSHDSSAGLERQRTAETSRQTIPCNQFIRDLMDDAVKEALDSPGRSGSVFPRVPTSRGVRAGARGRRMTTDLMNKNGLKVFETRRRASATCPRVHVRLG